MEKLKGWFGKIENRIIFIGAIVAFVGVTTPFFIMWLTNRPFKIESYQRLGTVGDFFGGTTVGLLSLASMIFVIAAIVMQKEELALQRKELEYTREELRSTREEYAITNKTMKLQRFETTLFNMISMHNELLKDIKYPEQELYGREALRTHYENINHNYRVIILNEFIYSFFCTYIRHDIFLEDVYFEIDRTISRVNSKSFSEEESKRRFEENYQTGDKYAYLAILSYDNLLKTASYIPENVLIRKFKEEYLNTEENEYKKKSLENAQLDHKYIMSNYLKSVKMILDFIEGSFGASNDLTKDEKEKYIQIFFAQFTIYEITLLFYYMYLFDDSKLEYYHKKYQVINSKEILTDSIIS